MYLYRIKIIEVFMKRFNNVAAVRVVLLYSIIRSNGLDQGARNLFHMIVSLLKVC